MYISRVEIDRDNRRKSRNLTHVGAYHAWVEESFPVEFEQSIRTRKLWRIDRIQNREYLIVVSEGKPDLLALEKYGVIGSAVTKVYTPFLERIHEGAKMRFRVFLNPTICKAISGQKRGAVMPHVTVEKQMQFLIDRSEKNGFLLTKEDFTIVESGYEVLKKSGERPIRLLKVVYEGTLVVSDTLKFKRLLSEGFGKKKAYGFGLMTVIPLGIE